MEKFYDKVLLLLSLCLLGVGVLMYFNLGGTSVYQGKRVSNSEEYQNIDFVASISEKADWVEPVAQAAGEDWLFEVFTPPKIWIDDNGEFTAEGASEYIPFGVSLAGFSKEKYRFQFQSFPRI